MHKTTLFALTLLTTLAGCFDSDEISDGYGETGGELLDCEDPIEVEADGSSWATCSNWTAWIETIDQGTVDSLVAAGHWTPAGSIDAASCYLFSPDALICTLEVGPFLAIGRPAAQLGPLSDEQVPGCSDQIGPWIATDWSPANSTCRAVFEDAELVVELAAIN